MRTIIFFFLITYSFIASSYELPRNVCLPDNEAAEKLSLTMIQIQFPSSAKDNIEDYTFKIEDSNGVVRVEISKKCLAKIICKQRVFKQTFSKADCSLKEFTLKM